MCQEIHQCFIVPRFSNLTSCVSKLAKEFADNNLPVPWLDSLIKERGMWDVWKTYSPVHKTKMRQLFLSEVTRLRNRNLARDAEKIMPGWNFYFHSVKREFRAYHNDDSENEISHRNLGKLIGIIANQ